MVCVDIFRTIRFRFVKGSKIKGFQREMTDVAHAIHTSSTIQSPEQKETNLRGLMREMKSVLVAYSGGVDSAYLGLIATEELGDKAVCVMGISPSVSTFQKAEAFDLARTFHFNFETVDTLEIQDPNYTANPSNRCYFCKSELFDRLAAIASERVLDHVVDGTNSDDVLDHRPGRSAADERKVRSPLAEAGFTKSDIRERSRAHGLPTWDRPASPCLSSRIAYGVPVTLKRLGRVERGEDYLRAEGFREFRVRDHGDLARIEIARSEMARFMTTDAVDTVAQVFKNFGFKYVTLDLAGFRSGSMNETDQIDTLEN
jgi:pyridinium-3,5-biscarboxylic acid mononucleotide sulfurtransferase